MVAYIRVQTDGEMTIRRSTIEEMLGRPFKMNDLEINLASFAGRIETDPEYVRFYFVKHL
ncbi:MmoB/DmpM family protein [Thiomonas delicata]|uniref:Toluene-4-monooxygenase system protein D n=2 Tax=root TaxID=1 RepID=A0A238D8V7_THIDL